MGKKITLPELEFKKKNWNLQLSFRMFQRQIPLSQLLDFEENSPIIYQPNDQEIDICVSDKVVARGVFAVRGGSYTVKITQNSSLLKVGLLTISDRAYRGEYEDQSGFAMKKWLQIALLGEFEILQKILLRL